MIDYDDHINLYFINWREETPNLLLILHFLSNPGEESYFYIKFRSVGDVVARRTKQKRKSKLHTRSSCDVELIRNPLM